LSSPLGRRLIPIIVVLGVLATSLYNTFVDNYLDSDPATNSGQASDEVIVPVPGPNFLTEPVIDPGGRTVASLAGDGTVSFWSVFSGELEREVEIPDLIPYEAGLPTLSSDGRFLAMIDDPNRSSDLVVHDLTGNGADLVLDRPGPLRELAFTPTGRFLVAITSDHRIQVWDLSTGEPLGAAVQAAPGPWALSDDGSRLVYLDDAGQVRSQDPNDPRTDGGLHVPFPVGPRTLAIDEGGSSLVGTVPDPQMQTWADLYSLDLRDSSASAERVHFLNEVENVIALAPTGRLAACPASEGRVVIVSAKDPDASSLWYAAPWEFQDQPATSLRFTPDGRALAVLFSDGRVVLWHNLSLSTD
jgi:WD40 repeat protein